MNTENTITLHNVAILNEIVKLGLDLNSFQTLHISNGQATLTAIYDSKLANYLSTRFGAHTVSDPEENAYIKFENYFLTIYLYLCTI